MNTPIEINANAKKSNSYINLFAGLGALGVALQNYQAVAIFMQGFAAGVIPVSRLLDLSIQIAAISTGGVCSGLVNLWMNIDLLEKFFKRMTSNDEYRYQTLTAWERVQYFGGIFVFMVTGIIFGLMAFTFAMEGPFAMLSIAAGVFVAAIMTIQELETWFLSYDNTKAASAEEITWARYFGKSIGHVIAVGNVFALSLLFTLSLAEGLLALQFTVLSSLMLGAAVAFTFGAFTEYYFYNVYLSDFCQNFDKKIDSMMKVPHAWFGLSCVVTNAFVNGALTYSGIELLVGLILTANIALPPLMIITSIAAVSALFAGSASLILGLDFWIEQNSVKTCEVEEEPALGLTMQAA